MANPSQARHVSLVVVTGLSGSGKTTALHALEDAGAFCVDNLPSPLLPTFLQLADEHPGIGKVAVAMDVRESSYYSDMARQIQGVHAAGHESSVLYLECGDEQVIRRYKETRRRHPMIASGEATTLSEAIARERAWLTPIRHLASVVIDTSALNVHELKRRVQGASAAPSPLGMALHLMSFGYRHGLPAEADFVFDVRYLPNPYFVPDLRPFTGLEADVAAFVLAAPPAQMILDRMLGLTLDVLPLAETEGKPSMTLAVGCTGGQHRSVAIVEALRERLAAAGRDASVSHRDLPRREI